MKKSLIALAFGTLGLGIAEFTMMGILPYVAQDLGISIPVAGHLISAYALGVCCGAPMLILWGIERSGFFNGREKWAKGFENQRV